MQRRSSPRNPKIRRNRQETGKKNITIASLLKKVKKKDTLVLSIKNATKKLNTLVGQSLELHDLEWALFRANYFVESAKSPKEYETLSIFVLNLSMILLKINFKSKSEFLLHKILPFVKYIKTFTRSLVFYSYSFTLLKLRRVEEAKVYCKKALKVIEKPVHDMLKKSQGMMVFKAKERESVTLMLNCYNHLLNIKSHLKNLSISTEGLPDDIRIAEKGQRIARKYLGPGSNFVKIFKIKIERKFQLSIKERLTYDTADLSMNMKSGNSDYRTRRKKQENLIGKITEELVDICGEEAKQFRISKSNGRKFFRKEMKTSDVSLKSGSCASDGNDWRVKQIGRRHSLSKFSMARFKKG